MAANSLIYDTSLIMAGPHVSVQYGAISESLVFYTAPRPMTVRAATLRVEVPSASGSAVTVMLAKVANGTAIASATDLLSSALNVKGTAATNQTASLVTDYDTLNLAKGDSLALVFTGSLEDATGNLTVVLDYNGFHIGT